MRIRSGPRIAVIALQGDFARHIERLEELGATAIAARLPEEILDANGVVLPGGESTTIGKLMNRYGLADAIRSAATAGKPIYGTCAGMILLARRIQEDTEERGGQPTLGLLDMTVARNAFGRQVESFEADIEPATELAMGEGAMHAVFIRAPIVTAVGDTIKVLATFEGKTVFVQQGKILASSFHPELTRDTRVHRYFLSLANQ